MQGEYNPRWPFSKYHQISQNSSIYSLHEDINQGMQKRTSRSGRQMATS